MQLMDTRLWIVDWVAQDRHKSMMWSDRKNDHILGDQAFREAKGCTRAYPFPPSTFISQGPQSVGIRGQESTTFGEACWGPTEIDVEWGRLNQC